MRRRMMRLALALGAIALTASPAYAQGCPSHVSDGNIVCHLVSGTHCSSCTYNCSDGSRPTWDMCDT